MPDHSGPRRSAARSELLPVAAVVLLGAILLGVATLWDGGAPDAATDPVAARADVTQAADPSRPRHDAEEREVDGELIEPLTATAPAAPRSTPSAGASVDPDLEKLRVAAESQRTRIRDVSFKVGTFNVLATQHTDPGGQHASWPSASWRTPQTIDYLRRSGVAVAGLQEVKSSQLAGITNGLGFQAWPGGSDPDNSIIWDPKVFDLVSTDSFSITFMHSVRPQTIIRLRHKQTKLEFYFLNMHTSAGGGKYAGSRAAGLDTAVSVINRLKADGIPIFLTGDMNGREEFFCRVMPPTGMVAAIGGSTAGGCRPARALAVDWVTATSDVAFSGYVEDRSPVARKVSDHHYVYATATVRSAG